MIILVYAIDLCRMPDINAVYPIKSAAECIKYPLLTKDIFEQNQKTVEELIQLHGFQDIAKNPPYEYQHLAVDIDAKLAIIRSKYQAAQNASAYDYFAALSALFLQLKDPHTLYVKSSFFSNFKKRLPLVITQKDDGYWYTEKLPFKDQSIHDGYKKLDFTQNFEQMLGKRIFKINGIEVEEYLMQQARKYCYSSKSDHGCFNSFIGNDMYYQNLKVYNLPETVDEKMTVQLLDGTSYSIYYVITTDKVINDSNDAQNLYEMSLVKKLSSNHIISDKTYEHILKKLDYKQPHPQSQNDQFSIIQQSPEFFTLYSYQSDLVLSIESFSPPDNVQALKDLFNVMQTIKQTQQGKLILSLVGNGGGWVSLGHLTAFMMFPEQYPIYGRYSIRKSRIQQLLMQAETEFEDSNRVDWITGEVYTYFQFQPEYVKNLTWYETPTKNNFTINYASDDDAEPSFKDILDKIYAFKGINYSPENIILITDALCGSTCSCFAKHLVQLKNVKSVGVGGYKRSSDRFDVSSFAGGVVMDSNTFEDSIKNLKSPSISEDDFNFLKSLYIPHDGFQRFAHQSIFSFDSLEESGIPLEYRSIQVDKVLYDIHPIYGNWQGPDGLAIFVQKAIDISAEINTFGYICDTDVDTHITSRFVDNNCVPYGCELGWYRVKSGVSFICQERVDPRLSRQLQEEIDTGIGMIIGIILLSCVVIAVIVLLAIFLLGPRLFKNNKVSIPEDEIALLDSNKLDNEDAQSKD